MSQNLQDQNAVITSTKQTMSAWSRLIATYENIPAIYKPHFDKVISREQPFPQVIWTPALYRFPIKTTEKLVCSTDDALYIFEKNGERIDAKRYAYRDIYSSEVGSILLESWLTIHGKTSEGKTDVSTVEFNTTSRRYFEDIFKKLRPSFKPSDKAQIAIEKEKFNRFATVNFKFMNYGRESLLPGEIVIYTLLQAEIREPLFTIFGKTFDRTLSLAHLTVLTDQELILIRETASARESRASSFGGVWQYIPLHTIASVALSEITTDRVTLSIQCRPERTIQTLFDASHLSELEQLRKQFLSVKERFKDSLN